MFEYPSETWQIQQPFNALGVFCKEQRYLEKYKKENRAQKAGRFKHNKIEGADCKCNPCIIAKTRHVKCRVRRQNILAHKNKLNQIVRECRQYM